MRYLKKFSVVILAAVATVVCNGSALAGNGFIEQLVRHGVNEATRPIRNIQRGLEDPSRIPTLPLDDALDRFCAPIENYRISLDTQAGTWKALPAHLIAAIGSAYSNDLSQVRYVEGIRTSNGVHQAFGNKIYFTRTLDLRVPFDMHEMLHELQHTVQFRGNTQSAKLCDYLLQFPHAGFSHDNMRWEREAEEMADRMLRTAMNAIWNPPVERAWSSEPAVDGRAGWGLSRSGSWASNSSLQVHQLAIRNETNFPIKFSAETSSTGWTVHTVQPYSSGVITGAPGDTWFNISVNTQGTVNTYGVNGGSVQAIRFNEQNVLDFYSL